MIELYNSAYQIIAPLMIISGLGCMALLDRLTILGRHKLTLIGMWMACSSSTLVGIGLLLGVVGTLFGDIVLGTGDIVLALSLPMTICGIWLDTRNEYDAKREEYFNKRRKGAK
jgi:hypothetical protein